MTRWCIILALWTAIAGGGVKKDLGLQNPRECGGLTVDHQGQFIVRHAIHPHMEMTVVVS